MDISPSTLSHHLEKLKNEELVTVNAELQGKVEELNLATSNMENLLASSEIATIFLDRALELRGFTPAAAAGSVILFEALRQRLRDAAPPAMAPRPCWNAAGQKCLLLVLLPAGATSWTPLW